MLAPYGLDRGSEAIRAEDDAVENLRSAR